MSSWGGNLSSALQEISFSHLILCTGTDGAFPGKFNTVASYQTAVQAYEDLVRQVRHRYGRPPRRYVIILTVWGVCTDPERRLGPGGGRGVDRRGDGR